MLIRNVLFLGACYTGSTSGFTAPLPAARITSLKNNYLDSIGADGDTSSSSANADTTPPPAARVEEPPSIDLDGQIVDRQSNLSFRQNRNNQSVNEDPRPFDIESRSVAVICSIDVAVDFANMSCRIEPRGHNDDKQTLAQGFGCLLPTKNYLVTVISL